MPCREKKAGATKRSGEEQAKKQNAKPALQQNVEDEADAKLSFGRIEIDKGELMSRNPCHVLCYQDPGRQPARRFTQSRSASLGTKYSKAEAVLRWGQAGHTEPRHSRGVDANVCIF